MKKKPYISVIITYFNKRRFIKKTLDSIFFQSFKNYELIFVYDDSNYEDLKYIKPYLKAFKNTKIIINKKNLGVARSRNKALAKCKGKIIYGGYHGITLTKCFSEKDPRSKEIIKYLNKIY